MHNIAESLQHKKEKLCLICIAQCSALNKLPYGLFAKKFVKVVGIKSKHLLY